MSICPSTSRHVGNNQLDMLSKAILYILATFLEIILAKQFTGLTEGRSVRPSFTMFQLLTRPSMTE